MYTPSKIEAERRRRIQVALWAYAYEIKDNPLVSDAKFDKTCLLIDLDTKTGDKKMDAWFQKHFDPSTGQWIHKHPNLKGIEKLYTRLTGEEDAADTTKSTKRPNPRRLR